MTTKSKIELYIAGVIEKNRISVPVSLIAFWADNYGLTINKIIIDKEGNEWVIDKVLSVDAEDEILSTEISWRNNSSPLELDYSAPYLESVLPNWEENDLLIPFAALNTENAAFDLLVINFLSGNIPKISIWVHEESNDIEAFFIDVADNCQVFLDSLK